MKARTVRVWSWLHRWSSLLCTLFLLMLCLTGLPLIFHDEIDAWLNPDTWHAKNPGGAHHTLDEIVDIALQRRIGEAPIFLSFDVHRPVVNVTSGPRADAAGADMHFASFDLTSGDLVPPSDVGAGVMDFILQLHTDLFLGLPGMLILGFMGLLFLVALISGVVLYAPFMRRLRFAEVRAQKSKRTRWLDWHNLMGIAALVWMFVVGLSGVINTLEKPIIDTWKARDLADLIAQQDDTADAGSAPLEWPRMASLDAAVQRAVQAAPDGVLQFVAFPGSGFSTAAHYAVFLHGNTPLTEHLITPVLIDARSGEFKGLRRMPWYAKALSLSRPLHFGDYGGLALKGVWAVLDLIAIAVLIGGLWLWWARRAVSSAATSVPGRADR